MNFIDNNRDSSDNELHLNSKHRRLSTSSSDYSIDDSSDSNMDYSQHCDVRYASKTLRVESQLRQHLQSRRNPDFVPRRCTICSDKGIESKLFDSRGRVTEHTKEAHGCWYNPYGDRYIPIDPDQLAEGRARKLARHVEQKHRQLCREREEREPYVMTLSLIHI